MDSPAHLLNLPRELRDRIYALLHHRIDFNWVRNGGIARRGHAGEVQVVEPVPIRLAICPLPHVFRIHPRIYEEYQEVYANKLTALINPPLKSRYSTDFQPLPDASARDNAVLARLRHVNLFVTLHVRSTGRSLDWEDQLGLFNALASEAPKLLTLRVAVRQQYNLHYGPNVDHWSLEKHLLPAAVRLYSTEEFLPRMPELLDNMVMVYFARTHCTPGTNIIYRFNEEKDTM